MFGLKHSNVSIICIWFFDTGKHPFRVCKCMEDTRADDFRTRANELADYSATLKPKELDEACRVGSSIVAVLERKEEQLLQPMQGRPLLQVYMSDGWSTRVSSTATECNEDLTVKRTGHDRHEFVLERGIMRGHTLSGEERFVMQLGPPRGLRHGKTTWDFLAAACDFQGTLRALGHSGQLSPCI